MYERENEIRSALKYTYASAADISYVLPTQSLGLGTSPVSSQILIIHCCCHILISVSCLIFFGSMPSPVMHRTVSASALGMATPWGMVIESK